MALIDDYRQGYENDTEFRQRLTVAFGQTITAILAGTPTTEQVNLGRLFAQNPNQAISQAQAFAVSFILNRSDPDMLNDEQIVSAVEQTITMLTSLGIGIPAPGA